MSLREQVDSLARQLGGAGVAALLLFALGGWLYAQKLQPLEARRATMERELARDSLKIRNGERPGAAFTRAAAPGEKLAAFYRFFEQEENTTDWLAALHSIARNVGVEMQTAQYRLSATPGRLLRYQITLPIKGSSAQVRAFADNALAAIPVLSLDQVNFRRKRSTEALTEAEVSFSLYLLQP